MLRLKNSEIDVLGNSAALVALVGSKALPASLMFNLAMFMKHLTPILTTFQETKQKVIEKYCDRAEDGSPLQEGQGFLINARRPEFIREYTDLLAVVVEVDCDRVKTALEKIPEGLLSSMEMMQLFSIIDFE